MAFVRDSAKKSSAEGYITASSYNDAHDVMSVLSSAIEASSIYDIEDEEPSYLYDQHAYKVVITVERI